MVVYIDLTLMNTCLHAKCFSSLAPVFSGTTVYEQTHTLYQRHYALARVLRSYRNLYVVPVNEAIALPVLYYENCIDDIIFSFERARWYYHMMTSFHYVVSAFL